MELTPFTRFLLWMLSQRPDVTIHLQDSSLAIDELDPDSFNPDDYDEHELRECERAFTIQHLEDCLILDPSQHHYP
jgi:hypothetical protein